MIQKKKKKKNFVTVKTILFEAFKCKKSTYIRSLSKEIVDESSCDFESPIVLNLQLRPKT